MLAQFYSSQWLIAIIRNTNARMPNRKCLMFTERHLHGVFVYFYMLTRVYIWWNIHIYSLIRSVSYVSKLTAICVRWLFGKLWCHLVMINVGDDIFASLSIHIYMQVAYVYQNMSAHNFVSKFKEVAISFMDIHRICLFVFKRIQNRNTGKI